ncbi:cytochrome P450 [Aspergillus californicus]
MDRLDSFIKESQRLNPLSLVAFERKAKATLTLTDGTSVPKGSFIAAPAYHVGIDPEIYEMPAEFDGLRFCKLRSKDQTGERGSKFRYDAPSEAHLHFGLGRHACPGRFLAGLLTKLVLGYVALNYDIPLPHPNKG